MSGIRRLNGLGVGSCILRTIAEGAETNNDLILKDDSKISLVIVS